MQLWRPRWYYILRNRTSGKLYAGQTVQDIERYCGSGRYWSLHCKKHGGYTRKNIETVEAVWIETREAAQVWLDDLERRHPEYWQSDYFANECVETTKESSLCGLTNEQRIAFGKKAGSASAERMKADPELMRTHLKKLHTSAIEWTKNNPELASIRSIKAGNATSEWVKRNPEAASEKGKKAGAASAKWRKENPEAAAVINKNFGANMAKGKDKRNDSYSATRAIKDRRIVDLSTGITYKNFYSVSKAGLINDNQCRAARAKIMNAAKNEDRMLIVTVNNHKFRLAA